MHVSLIPYLPESLCLWRGCDLMNFSNRKTRQTELFLPLPCSYTLRGVKDPTSHLTDHSVQEFSQFFLFPAARFLSSSEFLKIFFMKDISVLEKATRNISKGPSKDSKCYLLCRVNALIALYKCVFQLHSVCRYSS